MATATVGNQPGTVDLEVYRGDSVGPLEFTPQTTVDLSGRTWLAQVRASKDEPNTIIATFTVDASSAATGVIRITLPAAQSALLVTGTTNGLPTPGKGTYYWDLQATLNSDTTQVKTWFAGKVRVTGDVSVTP